MQTRVFYGYASYALCLSFAAVHTAACFRWAFSLPGASASLRVRTHVHVSYLDCKPI